MSHQDFDDFENFEEFETNGIDPIGKVTGMWKKMDENDKGCLEGSLGPYLKVRIHKNLHKRKPTHPDYNLCFYSVRPEKNHRED